VLHAASDLVGFTRAGFGGPSRLPCNLILARIGAS
jgi:hypothetical protein